MIGLTPCHFCQKVPFFTFHEMICNYIFWIDRDHTLLLEMKRYKNGPFAKLWISDKNDRLTPCHFCQKVSFFTFHEMICNYIFWIDRDHTLLLEMKRYKNGPFAKLWILDKNDRLTPCHFCQKVVILNISWNDLQLHILNRQRSYTTSRDEKIWKWAICKIMNFGQKR